MAEEEGKSSLLGSNPGKALAIIVVLLLVGGLAGWRFIHWMEEDEQCGAICHNHEPYYEMYQGTAHQQAGVMCKECHTSPGITGFISSQIVNTGNVFKFYILGGDYKGDFSVIKSHVDEREWLNKAAPMENCQRSGCHDNNKFISAGKTRGFEYDSSMFVAAGEGSQRSPEDEPKTTLVSESTNEKNTEGILSFHQLHIQAPTEGEDFVEPHCQDCHGNVMDKDGGITSTDYQQEDWTLTYEGSLPAPLRGALTGGTRQTVPTTICLGCHDGEKAPGLYGDLGGEFPTDLPN